MIMILVLLMILVLKMTKKYTHLCSVYVCYNMILMSRYKGQLHGGKKGTETDLKIAAT